jgi:penicillin-binding protein 1A
VFRDFMIAALKDAPATAFRTPPGMRLYRVNPSTGLPAAAGEPAIYEAYKPGTEPGKNRNLGMQRVPGGEKVPVASAPEGEPETIRSTMPRVPASGTGGLY